MMLSKLFASSDSYMLLGIKRLCEGKVSSQEDNTGKSEEQLLKDTVGQLSTNIKTVFLVPNPLNALLPKPF